MFTIRYAELRWFSFLLFVVVVLSLFFIVLFLAWLGSVLFTLVLVIAAVIYADAAHNTFGALEHTRRDIIYLIFWIINELWEI